jgi:hypothetical protein
MKLFDGDRPADDVLVHLTAAEARAAISALTDLLDDADRVGLPVALSTIVDGPRQVTFYVYPDEITLDADTAD